MDYYFDQDQYVIKNFDQKKTFSSFLPGIAGIKGIPLWGFYANRGQGITSFGIRDKDEAILEFFPANTGYQYVDRYGFRSFVKVDGDIFEPFSITSTDEVQRNMYISKSNFTIEEHNKTKKLIYRVTYFGLPNEPVAGLVRKVVIKNLAEDRNIEVVDGIATILPSGATTSAYKEMSNLMRSWMDVQNLENNIPFYKFRASSGDEAEVTISRKGHFYLSFVEDHQLIQPIVDINIIFGYDTSLTKPLGLYNKEWASINTADQVVVNKVPCGFSMISREVKSHEEFELNTIIGHVADVAIINEKKSKFASRQFISHKLNEAKELVEHLVGGIETRSNLPIFDAYLKQNYLDNTLRGGFPLVIGKEHKKVYHVFSRKHGDPERDYNFFNLDPEFYSQGNGNFRDVNQNRRNDVFFVPESGIYNIKTFMSLIQIDGYNPLSVKGSKFTMDIEQSDKLIDQLVLSNHEKMRCLLSKPFTPGQISMTVLLQNIDLSCSEAEFIQQIIDYSEQHIEAEFGEGYWVDHWTYNLDLIENYLSVYPDKLRSLMFEDCSYRYFSSPVQVNPRHEKYGLTVDNKVRQYGATKEIEAKSHDSKWLKYNKNQIYKTHLAQKILSLILNKYALLDPNGMGIEMEANKPGWNDAMNGLPGIFGSGLSETVELLRLVKFFIPCIDRSFYVLKENDEFLKYLGQIQRDNLSDFERWHKRSEIRETFRSKVYKGIEGKEVLLDSNQLLMFLRNIQAELTCGINKATKNDILPTYFSYEVSKYHLTGDTTSYGLKGIQASEFKQMEVPLFLEAPARYLKVCDYDTGFKMYHKIKASKIYDHDLSMYKTSEPLNEMSHDLGRIRAFTPGWLERESNFLHMTYKYLLGLIKCELYDEFFEEMNENLVCFMEPETYGRSILENSSFIATSQNPDHHVHGQGFVARLSGSTAEMISIWQLMMFGKSIFNYDKKLRFTAKPILHHSLFKQGLVETTLFSTVKFVIENNTGLSTYHKDIEVKHYLVDGVKYNVIEDDIAEKVRACRVNELRMIFQRKGEVQ